MTQYNGLYKFRCVLSAVLALAVLLLALPAWSMTASAAETAEPEHDHSGWSEINRLPSEAGSYYLAGNVSGSWTAPSGETNLCLNGNTISGKITVPSGATLNIYDEGSGKVTYSGNTVAINSGGEAYIYGGTFENSSGHDIYVYSGGFLQIDGGTFKGSSGSATIVVYGEAVINQADVSGPSNAVYARGSNGKAYIYGGNFESISYDTMAVETGAYMYINMINGGTITNNKSEKNAIGVNGTAEIDYAVASGSGIAVNVIKSSSSVVINGGSFNSTSNDTVTNSGTLTITGGDFIGKQYAVKNSGTFNLSNSPTFSSEQADIYLASGKINITGALNNTTPYSVLTATPPTKSSPVEITNSSTTSYNDKTKFTPVNSSYIVRKNNSDQLELAVPANPCAVTFDFNDGVTAPETVIYEKGDTYDTLPAPPARTGYIFKGWYGEDGEEVTEDTEVTADHTLKAKWEECKHDNIKSWSKYDKDAHTAVCDCGETVYKDHNWTVTSKTEPTETEAGKEISTCDDCGEEKTKELPATGSTSGGNTGDGDNTDNTDNGDMGDSGNTGDNDDNNDTPPSSGTVPPIMGGNTPSTGDTGNTNAPSGDTTEPSTGDTTSPSTGDNTSDENGAGDVNIGSSSSENAPEATISAETSAKLKEEMIAEHLTDEEKAAVANGDSLDIILVVEDAGDTVPAEDKQITEAVLTSTEYNIGMYLNVDLIKLINGQQVGKITEINSPIHVTIEIPEELRSANRAFAIVRVHNGAAEILEDVDDDPDTITIVTDKFSTYSIAYQDTDANPNTGAATPIAITGLACAVIVAAVAVKRKKIIE